MLGNLAITGSETDYSIPWKGWAVLAILAMDSGSAHPRERLAEMFWPDLPEGAARNNLRQVLLILQKTFRDHTSPCPCLIADRNFIRFNPECRHHFDIHDFLRDIPACPAHKNQSFCENCLTQMESLVSLYRGDFMTGFYLSSCPDFDEWLERQREMLRNHALVLLERISKCYEALGDTGIALPSALRFTELEPWNEEGQRRVMRLMALNGQPAVALVYYESCCRMLKLELDLLPEHATNKLADIIRNGELIPAVNNARHELPPPLITLERRQVTVLYCRFTAAEIDDLDDEFELLRVQENRCVEIIQRFAGYVVRTNDGGVLAYFGYPRARENAARRAVQAALAISRMDLRVGINSGHVITGGAPGLPDVIGKTSGMAMRLLVLARPGAVVISAATYRLVAGYFECVGVDPQQLQNDTLPKNVFRVVRESGAVHRLEAATALSVLIGREQESGVLTALWHKAQGGTRQVLLLQGDPGIGKSRLVHHLKQSLAEQHAVRELRCFAEYSHSPFHPVIGMFEELLGFAFDDSPETKFAKLTAYAEQNHPDSRTENAPLLAALLSLPTRSPYREQTLLPQQLRDRTMTFLIELLFAAAGGTTTLLVVEDLHWIDPTTLELLSRFLADNRPAPLLVLFTTRPEFQSPWQTGMVPTLTISPLVDNNMLELIAALELEMPPETVRLIVDRADGVPLFAEELARALPTAGNIGHSSIPATLHDLLTARLDGLGEARFIAQLAATVGREFQFDLLSELSMLDRQTILQSLYRLLDAGLVSGDIEAGFQFRHVLFQDAAYQSQTRTDRQAVHRRIAEVLQLRSADLAGERPEVLARHWTAAGEPEIAIGFWIRAGQLAALHYAQREAINHFRSGLVLIRELPDDQRKARLEFELQVGIGSACYATEGYGSPDGVAAYGRAVALGEGQWNTPALFQALWGLWASTSSRTNYQESLELTQRLVNMSRMSGDPVEQQQACFAAGNIQFWRGEFVEAREYLERAMSLYRPKHNERHVTGFGENAFVTSGAYLSWTLCALGLPDQAKKVSRRTLAAARRIEHPFSLGYAQTFATVLQRMLRQTDETLKQSEETIILAVAHGFPLWEVGATLKQGWALVMLGKPEGVELMRHCVDSVRAVMSSLTVIFLETLADGLRHQGQFEESLMIIDQAQEAVERLGDRHVEAELHRFRGECLLGLAAANEAEAETSFRQAISVARRQQSRLFELRAAVSMARLWRSQGKMDQAHQLLAGVYSNLTEGFDTPDLQDARRLLAELGPLCSA